MKNLKKPLKNLAAAPENVEKPSKNPQKKHFFERSGLKSHQGGARAKRAPPFWWFFGAKTFQKRVRGGFKKGFWRVFQHFRGPRQGFKRVLKGFFGGIGKTLKTKKIDSFSEILIFQNLAVLGVMV